MAKDTRPEVEAKEVSKEAPQDQTTFQDTDHVQYHLDVDPNDPRNRVPTPKLPSLDDEGQS